MQQVSLPPSLTGAMHDLPLPSSNADIPDRFKIEGVIWKKRKRGRIPIWIASRRARELGFTPKTEALFGNIDAIRARAMALSAAEQAWMREYLDPRMPKIARYRDRLDDMLDLYQDHEASPFRRLEYRSQQNTIYHLQRLRKEIGECRVSRLHKLDLDGIYRKFRAPKEAGGKERVAMAHALMVAMKSAASFCTGLYPSADRLLTVLQSMRFEQLPARNAYMTAEMVIAFRREAHRQERPSLALGTTLQFETGLRQGDTIGRWCPDKKIETVHVGKRGHLRADLMWGDGLTWEDNISVCVPADGERLALILQKPTNKTKHRKVAMSDLTMCEMVVEELRLAYPGCITEERALDSDTGQMTTILVPHRELLPADGPMILDEDNGEPWIDSKFRREWREIANAAGIPKEVKNMDNRAGAVTEGSDAEAPDEHLRLFATHSKFNTTRRYNRATLHKSQTVHAARANLRARRRRGLILEHARPALEYQSAAE
jgi:hypothetical protein